MIKSELKAKWGAFADTDKLVDDMMELLTTYSHRNSEHGVCSMLDVFFTNKQPLIELLKKVDGFGADLRLVVTKNFERTANKNDIYYCVANLKGAIINSKMMLSNVDDDGKTFNDYLKTGVKKIDISSFEDIAFLANIKTREEHLRNFTDHGYTQQSKDRENKFNNTISLFQNIIESTINESTAKQICGYTEDKRFAAGLKTSRAFNRACELFGVTTYKDYNKMFAEYSDMVSGGSRQLDFIVSLNPYDYLTMSFGKSWSSCHTIDKLNVRNMPSHYNGQYCGGTLSYMLDGSSIITYVIDKDSDPKTCGKIYRNMFHYESPLLVQGRVYPQGNNGATNLYDTFRGYMLDVLNKALEMGDEKWEKMPNSTGNYTFSEGKHYRDYTSFNDCHAYKPRNATFNNNVVRIGHSGICPYCGETYSTSSYLAHTACSIR